MYLIIGIFWAAFASTSYCDDYHLTIWKVILIHAFLWPLGVFMLFGPAGWVHVVRHRVEPYFERKTLMEKAVSSVFAYVDPEHFFNRESDESKRSQLL